MRRTIVVVGCVVLGLASVAQAADIEKGKTLYVVCAACHGASGQGNQALNAPKLAGQEGWFIERQLGNFQKGVRGSDPKDIYGLQMKPLAATLDAAGVADVAAYLSSLPWTPTSATIQGDAEKGKSHFATCTACHGQKGEGNQALNAPRIAGQEDWYLVRQLENFSAGLRGSNPQDAFGAQMKPIVQTLATNPGDTSAFKDVAAYINTIK